MANGFNVRDSLPFRNRADLINELRTTIPSTATSTAHAFYPPPNVTANEAVVTRAVNINTNPTSRRREPFQYTVPSIDALYRENDAIADAFTGAIDNENTRRMMAQMITTQNAELMDSITDTSWTRTVPPLETVTRTEAATATTTAVWPFPGDHVTTDSIRVGSLNGITIGANGTITTGNLSVSDSAGMHRFSVNNAGEVKRADTHYLPTQVEEGILTFFREKLNLKVALSPAGKGFEIKVSLNVTDTDEEILSDTDYVEV